MKAKFAFFDDSDCKNDCIFCLTITEENDIPFILDDLAHGVKGRFEFICIVPDPKNKRS